MVRVLLVTAVIASYMLFSGCGEEDFQVLLEIPQAERLLTADSSKIWIPEGDSFQECEFDNRYIFSKTGTGNSIKRVYTEEIGEKTCPGDIIDEEEGDEDTGDEATVVYSWLIERIGNSNYLTIYHTDTIEYRIDLITASDLTLMQESEGQVLQFNH